MLLNTTVITSLCPAIFLTIYFISYWLTTQLPYLLLCEDSLITVEEAIRMGLSSFIICIYLCMYVSLQIKYFIYSILLKKLSNSELFILSYCQSHHTKNIINFQIII